MRLSGPVMDAIVLPRVERDKPETLLRPRSGILAALMLYAAKCYWSGISGIEFERRPVPRLADASPDAPRATWRRWFSHATSWSYAYIAGLRLEGDQSDRACPVTREAHEKAAAMRHPPSSMTLLASAIALAVLIAACGTTHESAAVQPKSPPSPWPSAADYGTIRTAVAVRNDALFHQTDWRRKSYAASLAARTLLTVHMAAGPCAAYVANLYANLRDLMDAYDHEDWRPLVQLVRREPALADGCRQPRAHFAA
jgi:hypothetical protein